APEDTPPMCGKLVATHCLRAARCPVFLACTPQLPNRDYRASKRYSRQITDSRAPFITLINTSKHQHLLGKTCRMKGLVHSVARGVGASMGIMLLSRSSRHNSPG